MKIIKWEEMQREAFRQVKDGLMDEVRFQRFQSMMAHDSEEKAREILNEKEESEKALGRNDQIKKLDDAGLL